MRVGIGGASGTKFTRKGADVAELAAESAMSALAGDPGVDKNEIDAVIISTNHNTRYLGAITASRLGIRPKICHTVESMCVSGAGAVLSACAYVESGMARTALVVGVDAFDGPGRVLEWDRARGEFVHPVFWASLFTRAYRAKRGASERDIAAIAAKNHKSAQSNPNALSKRAYSIDEIMGSKKITDDLRLLECSAPASGAAAILLKPKSDICIAGAGSRTAGASFTGDDPTRIRTAADAAGQAFRDAAIEPGDVDVAELHDAFAVCEAMLIEEVGMAKNGAKFARELHDTGDPMINPRGGLIGAGHPLAATGVAQVAEIALQLRGRAGARQVDGAEVGITHNMAAAGTSSAVMVIR